MSKKKLFDYTVETWNIDLDRLAERNIPVYIDVGCNRILVKA